MEIVIHNHFTLASASDIYEQYQTPIWEIEIQSDTLDSPEFEALLRCNDNFAVSEAHQNNLRSTCTNTELLSTSHKDTILSLVSQHPVFKARYFRPVEYYQYTASWFSTIIRDRPGFEMKPHLDNNHVMVQLIVNLLQDNDTATEFYHFNETMPCYRAPLKKNHGVFFVNSPGSIHSISNVTKERWIWYGGLII